MVLQRQPSVTNGPNSVSVIGTANGHIAVTIHVGSFPQEVAVSPVGNRAHVTNSESGSVSVIGTATNQVIATIHGFSSPEAVAADPGGTHTYVTNDMSRGTYR